MWHEINDSIFEQNILCLDKIIKLYIFHWEAATYDVLISDKESLRKSRFKYWLLTSRIQVFPGMHLWQDYFKTLYFKTQRNTKALLFIYTQHLWISLSSLNIFLIFAIIYTVPVTYLHLLILYIYKYLMSRWRFEWNKLNWNWIAILGSSEIKTYIFCMVHKSNTFCILWYNRVL